MKYTVYIVSIALKTTLCSAKSLYLGSGIQFLTDYNEGLKIVTRYYDNSLKQYSPQLNNTKRFYEHHSVRDLSNYATSYQSTAGKPLYNATTYYPLLTKRNSSGQSGVVELLNYNDRFRFGLQPHQRFLSIFFSANLEAKSGGGSVIFIGVRRRSKTSANKPWPTMYCDFLLPLNGYSVVLENAGEFYRCRIPEKVLTAIMNAEQQLASINLLDANRNVLIPNIHVSTLPEIDRRSFNLTLASMVNKINSPLLCEWLVYNLLLGVEHFYLFDNRAVHTIGLTPSVTGCLQPFLDANLVTLLYFPYVPLGGKTWQEHWNTIQKSFFTSVLQQFGPFTEWMGIYDMDEYFVPPKGVYFGNCSEDGLQSKPGHHLLEYLESLEAQTVSSRRSTATTSGSRKGKSPPRADIAGFMFNTVDAACTDLQPASLFHTENVFSTSQVKAYFVPEKKVYSPVTRCRQVNGTTHSRAHSKSFIKPRRVASLSNPHDIAGTVRVGNSAGLFRHFNGFRYSSKSRWKLSLGADDQSPQLDSTLPNFVTDLVRDLFAPSSC